MPEKIRIIGVPMDLGASRRGGVDMGPSAFCASQGFNRDSNSWAATWKTSAMCR